MSAPTDAPRSAPTPSPVPYGTIGDLAEPAWGTAFAAVSAVLVCPPALLLAPRLRVIA